jgi:hypothetical protein
MAVGTRKTILMPNGITTFGRPMFTYIFCIELSKKNLAFTTSMKQPASHSSYKNWLFKSLRRLSNMKTGVNGVYRYISPFNDYNRIESCFFMVGGGP